LARIPERLKVKYQLRFSWAGVNGRASTGIEPSEQTCSGSTQSTWISLSVNDLTNL